MATISEMLAGLVRDRDSLKANIATKGVDTTGATTFTALAQKVLEIETGGGGAAVTIYDSATRNTVYTMYNETTYTVDEFEAAYPGFCSADNDYVLNYANSVLGWDISVYTCSVTPVTISSANQIAMEFMAGSTETGVLRLVTSDSASPADIITSAQTEGQYIDLGFSWLYMTDYITTLTSCVGVTAGTYYLVWVGQSNNSQPKIKSISII